MQREFQIGSKWVYYKIYCGVKIADTILLEYLKETIALLKDEKQIEKWFFIRYNDPESHIRLRFLLTESTNLTKVIALLSIVFETLQEQNLIGKVQLDTYVRELERYGASSYEVTETLFEKDSEMVLEYLKFKNSFSDNKFPLLFSFLSIDSFLQLFQLSNEDKLTFLHQLQHSFKAEFNASSTLKTELDKHYRSFENQITEVLLQKQEEFQPIFDLVNSKNNKIKSTTSLDQIKFEVPIYSFLSSHIHMMINRQYTSRQREYELVIYDHLHRYYKTQNHIFK
jgi:thiopeptide-type bacteriocin biosynthesis protein